MLGGCTPEGVFMCGLAGVGDLFDEGMMATISGYFKSSGKNLKKRHCICWWRELVILVRRDCSIIRANTRKDEPAWERLVSSTVLNFGLSSLISSSPDSTSTISPLLIACRRSIFIDILDRRVQHLVDCQWCTNNLSPILQKVAPQSSSSHIQWPQAVVSSNEQKFWEWACFIDTLLTQAFTHEMSLASACMD